MKILVLDAKHAWGYHSPPDFKYGKNSKLKKIISIHNGLNAASILLSPLIGIIRIIFAAVIMKKLEKPSFRMQMIDRDAVRRFCLMEMGRGVLEILCLGLILGTVVDGAMTCKHKEMFCFSPVQTGPHNRS